MAEIVRVPIDIALTGGNYAASIAVGAAQKPLHVILDTGSSMLVVDGAVFDPSEDPSVTPTQMVQRAEFASGTFMAAVMRGAVGLTTAPDTPAAALPNANLAVTYDNPPGTFGQADGIFGLGFAALNKAFRMPANTWDTRYTAEQLNLGQETGLDPFFDQWVAAQRVANKFAFAIDRSTVREALDDPASDPANNGLFVLGGGAECDDLYTGPFTDVAIVHEEYYNANLTAIMVGDRSMDVPPVAAGAKVVSNAIIDSGATNLMLDQTVYDRLIALFRTVNPDLAQALVTYAPNSGRGVGQSQIDLARWPPISFVMQGAGGNPAAIAVQPKDYWQFDTGQAGNASPVLVGDGGLLGGQSNLGLPLFAGHFVVFDRTGGTGRGLVGFAARADTPLIG